MRQPKPTRTLSYQSMSKDIFTELCETLRLRQLEEYTTAELQAEIQRRRMSIPHDVEEFPISPEDQATIDNDFTHHSPTPEQSDKFPVIRGEAKSLCETLYKLARSTPERTLAKRKLEEFVFWSNAAIARDQLDDETPPHSHRR